MMLGEFNFFIVFYTLTEENQNEMVHMVGFNDAPTILDTKKALDDAINEKLVPVEDKPVYMAQVDRQTACNILGIDG